MNKKKRGIVLAITIIISTIVLGIVITAITSVYLAIADRDNDRQGYLFGYKPVIVVTGSMVPAIQINSVSLAKKCSVEDVEIGDIIMYKDNNGLLITHRVIDKTEIRGDIALITKGDANDLTDNVLVTNENIKAKLVYTANFMAPIISEIMPEPGMVNTLAVFRSLMIIVLVIIALSLVITGIIRATKQIYWTITGDAKFDEVLDQYSTDIVVNDDIHNEIKKDKHIAEHRLRLIDRLVIGMYRARLAEYIRDMEKATKKMNKKYRKYHIFYGESLIRVEKRQQELLERLKSKNHALQKDIEREEQIYSELSVYVKNNETIKLIKASEAEVKDNNKNEKVVIENNSEISIELLK